MKKTPIRVLLIDDDAVFRFGAEGLLKQAKDILLVAQAETGEYALTLLPDKKPDVLLVDIHLGLHRLTGPALIERLQQYDSSLPCISLTIEENSFMLLQMLDAGVAAIIRKNRIDMIEETIRVVYGGGHIIQPDIAFDIIQALRERQILGCLTPNEFDTFQRTGMGQDNYTIAMAEHLSESTVRARFNSIKQKLHLDTKTELIQLYQRFFPWNKNANTL